MWTKKYRLSPLTATRPYVDVASPGRAPVAVPQSVPAGVQAPPDHLRLRSSAGPYTPASSWPSMTGADAATGMVVTGTTVIVRFSLADEAGVEYEVATPIVFWSVVVPGSLIAAPGSVASVFVSVNMTCVSAPAASGPYGLDV